MVNLALEEKVDYTGYENVVELSSRSKPREELKRNLRVHPNARKVSGITGYDEDAPNFAEMMCWTLAEVKGHMLVQLSDNGCIAVFSPYSDPSKIEPRIKRLADMHGYTLTKEFKSYDYALKKEWISQYREQQYTDKNFLVFRFEKNLEDQIVSGTQKSG